ncbi:ribosomal protein S6 [Podospora fimiseda]|uniref:Small ribosomal subunit protein bS6m n=1 Tax=Podospora fimiseda TaxID=252190 RepID=A0AAN7BIJ9_9PEZI|nr:ribosomal protein S6 [Podospora fimiseda]
MLYETIGIIRHSPGNVSEIKDIVLATGQMILRNGGVIRDIANWGVFALPRAVSKNQQRHTKGHYFVMRYDCGIAANEAVRQTLAIEPRVIRATNVKLGDGKLERLSRFGKVEWRKMEG